MRISPRIAMFAAMSMTLATSVFAADWQTDLAKAQAQAKTENKQILIDFTGSDWCGWCIKLDKEVFSQKEFEEYAKKNLILLEIDFPRKKQLSAELKAQNEALAKKYNIEGFPTIIVLNPDGTKAGELGYTAGGPAAFIDVLKKEAPALQVATQK